jgi:hypothetical protein
MTIDEQVEAVDKDDQDTADQAIPSKERLPSRLIGKVIPIQTLGCKCSAEEHVGHAGAGEVEELRSGDQTEEPG